MNRENKNPQNKKLSPVVYSLKSKSGFTLIELLIAIAIVGIIASVAFVALDPLKRFRDARDSTRFTDVTAILTAIKVDQVDNGGGYASAISALDTGTIYMIGTGSAACNATCDAPATSTSACVDLTSGSDDLVSGGYLAEIPVSPNGTGSWDDTYTGYTLRTEVNGSVTIAACESENVAAISVAR